MFNSEQSKPIIIILLIAFIATLPALYGVYYENDLAQHVFMAHSFENALANKDFLPSMAYSSNNNYGGFSIRMYPPLFEYLFGLCHLIFKNWTLSVFTVLFLFNLIGSLGIYALTKEFVESRYNFLSCIFFVLVPFRLHEIYNSSMYAEFAGTSLLIFSFLYITRLFKHFTWENLIKLAAVHSLVIITHLPVAIFGSLLLGAYAILLAVFKKDIKSLLASSASMLIALVLSSFFWIKLLFEAHLLKVNTEEISDHFNFKFNFLLQNYSVTTPLWWFSLLLAVSFLVIILNFFMYFIANSKTKDSIKSVYILSLALVFLLSLFMTTWLSYPIWMIIPVLQKIQFPWRILTLNAIFVPVFMMVIIEIFRRLKYDYIKLKSIARLAFYTILVVNILLIGSVMFEFFAHGDAGYDFNTMADQRIATNMEPRWAQTTLTSPSSFYETTPLVDMGENKRSIEVVNFTGNSRLAIISSGNPTVLKVSIMNYPHWKVKINDVDADKVISPEGDFFVLVNEKMSIVSFIFIEPFYVKSANIITALCWILMIFLFVKVKRMKLAKLNKFKY